MVDSTSFLFVTLDSCRYDTFAAAQVPHMKSVGPLHCAIAPGNFTYSSHAAMFVGFTPGVARLQESYVNPKYNKIFRMVGTGFPGKGEEFVTLEGRNLIDGLNRRGYVTLGTGAVGWLNPDLPMGRTLTGDFHRFYYPGNTHSLPQQLSWIQGQLGIQRNRPVLVFLNIGETHIPYYYEGAPWSRLPSPCVPFGEQNDAAECHRRQKACLEYVDTHLAGLLEQFQHASILLCADHGDCWGEDGLWAHGFHHVKVLEVPLVFRLGQQPPPLVRPLWRRVGGRVKRTLLRRPSPPQPPPEADG